MGIFTRLMSAIQPAASLLYGVYSAVVELPAEGDVRPIALGANGGIKVESAQSSVTCTWQVTAGTSVKPLVPVWVLSTAQLVGEPCTLGGSVYRCVTAGATAGSGGPTGTTADITDGTVHWAYVGPVASAFPNGFVVVNIDGTSIVYYGTSAALTTVKASAPLTVSGGSIALPAAPGGFYLVAGASAIVGVTAIV